jgi:hypothetical protein
MKSIDTLIEDIHSLLDPQTDHIASEENLEAAGEAFKSALRDALKKYEKKGDLRFSGLGKQDRQLWYDKHADPDEAEEMTPETYIKFLYGHLLEAMLIFLIKEAGHEVTCEQEEVEVEGVKGHMDLVVDGYVVDIKSASPYGFKKFEDGELQPADDAFGYIRQLSGYAAVKELPAAFLAIEKVSGKLALSKLSEYAIRGHPPAPRIVHLKAALDRADEPPARCYDPVPDGKSGNEKLSTPCGYCKWKWKCHPGLRGFAYSGGPRFLTKVERVPDVPEFKFDGRKKKDT